MDPGGQAMGRVAPDDFVRRGLLGLGPAITAWPGTGCRLGFLMGDGLKRRVGLPDRTHRRLNLDAFR